MMGLLSLITGRLGPSGFGLASIAEEVTEGIGASNLTATVTVTGTATFFLLFYCKSIKIQITVNPTNLSVVFSAVF
jgi:hypothetical protein